MLGKLFNVRNVAVVMVVLLLASGVYAFAAANVVPESGAGQGAGDISGYTVTNVTYTLDSTDPQELDAVDFDLAATAGAGTPSSVEVQMDSTGGTWYSCTAGTPPAYSCTVTDTLLVADMDSLNVVAAE
jgi:hypothetical protein